MPGTSLLDRIWRHFQGRKVAQDPEVDRIMEVRETVFKAPPLTNKLIRGIKLITPGILLSPNEQSRRFWEADQNVSSWAEMDVIQPIMRDRARPSRVLEIGPGFGRSVIFFTKELGWDNVDYHLFEGTGSRTKYTISGPRFKNSFCGNIPLLRQILEVNGITRYTVLDAADYDFSFGNLQGTYDFICSFYAVGFHWSLENFLGDVAKRMHAGSIAFFTVPNNFRPFPGLDDFSYVVYETHRTPSQPMKLLQLMPKKDSH